MSVAWVRGFEDIGRYEPYLTAEPGRISLAHAPVEVLAAVPGFTRETADLLAQRAKDGTPVTDLTSLVGTISAPSARSSSRTIRRSWRRPPVIRTHGSSMYKQRAANVPPPWFSTGD